MSTSNKIALSVYRSLLKTQKKQFAGDMKMILAAKQETRKGFEKNRDLTDTKKIEKALKHGREVDQAIRKLVVQGVPSEKDPNKFKINLNSEHEIRDNPPVPSRCGGGNKA